MSLPWFIVAGLAAYLLWDDTVSKTQKALREWTPEDFWEKEVDFRSDLADFLRESLPEVYVVEEHGHGRGRRDIRIENRESEVSVAIELKYRMRTSNDVSRLLGQVLRYKSDVKAVFLVLIDSEPNLFAEIEKQVSMNFDEDTVEIVALNTDELSSGGI